jgi:hypothetical protein
VDDWSPVFGGKDMSWLTKTLGIDKAKKDLEGAIERVNATPAADRPECLAATAEFTSDGNPVTNEQWLAVEKVKTLYSQGLLDRAITPNILKVI